MVRAPFIAIADDDSAFANYLKTFLDARGYLARVYSHGYAFKILQAAMLKAKIPAERPFHSLRNSLASRMVLDGQPLSVVADAIGDSLQTTSPTRSRRSSKRSVTAP